MKTAYIALGGNLGNVKASFDSACLMLSEHCNITCKSKLYQTPALTAPSQTKPQPDYTNGLIEVQTSLEPAALLKLLHNIEAKHGRERLEHWGARTLDLDLIAYEDIISNDQTLMLPHPLMHERMFVLQPFADVNPSWIHPVLHSNIQEMIDELEPC